MQFESRIKRNLILSPLIAFVPDIIIVALATYLLDGGWVEFFLGLIALELALIAIWIVRSLWGWFLFWFVGRKSMAAQFFEYLLANKAPDPSDYAKSAESYFEEVMGNKDLNMEFRIKAACDYGSFVTYRTTGQLQQLTKVAFAMEDAMEEYRRHLLKSESGPRNTINA